MPVIRVEKTKDYTVMSNYHLKDKELSLKAKGLLSTILSLPDNWNYTVGGLVAICYEGESAVTSALKELKKSGYLRVDKIKPNKENGGKYEYIYNIFEQPKENQGIENQPLENQSIENQGIENHAIYKSTDKSSTNVLNTNTAITQNKKKERKANSYDAILAAVSDDELRDLYYEYIKMRKLIKSPMTDKALVMLINKVHKLEPESIERQKQMLENAITSNWKSVYPLKEDKQQGGTGNIFVDMLNESESGVIM